MIIAHIDASRLREQLVGLDRNLQVEAAIALEATAQSVVHEITTGYWVRRSGRTSASFAITRHDQLVFRIGSASKIARFLNDGTRPHAIWPKAGRGFQGPVRQGQSRGRKRAPGQVLRFVANGAVVFARRVRHPGTARLGFEGIEARRANSVTLPALMREAVSRARGRSGL